MAFDRAARRAPSRPGQPPPSRRRRRRIFLLPGPPRARARAPRGTSRRPRVWVPLVPFHRQLAQPPPRPSDNGRTARRPLRDVIGTFRRPRAVRAARAAAMLADEEEMSVGKGVGILFFGKHTAIHPSAPAAAALESSESDAGSTGRRLHRAETHPLAGARQAPTTGPQPRKPVTRPPWQSRFWSQPRRAETGRPCASSLCGTHSEVIRAI